jgi:hypothetical protein
MNYDGAKAYLVGEKHKGMRAMFVMMNAARLYVGVQGLGIMEVAYQNALAYAKDRLQMRSLTGPKFPDKPADPIIVHPDVRKMILTQRALTEGSRALALEMALKIDLAHRHPDEKVKRECDDFVQLMTPITKSYLTDGGYEMASLAMQVYGGMGYITESGVEQYVRDARITMIYEGTNGVQALDLVGRKLPQGAGRYLRSFFHPATEFVAKHKDNAAMAEFTKPLHVHIGYLQQATLWVASRGMANPDEAGAASVEYQKMFAQVALAWIWARQAAIALTKLGVIPSVVEGSSKKDPSAPLRSAQDDIDKEFYQAKIDTARFYMARILPQNVGLLASLTNGSKSIMQAAV